MDAALIAATALLGLAGTPHCAAMCGAPCAAAVGGRGPVAMGAFQAARVLSYAAAGALVAASVSALAGWSQVAPVLRPLWTLLHLAALVLGAWLLWQGRQPAWLSRLGRAPHVPAEPAASRWRPLAFGAAAPAVALAGPAAPSGGGGVADGAGSRRGAAGSWRAAMAGAVWAAWPCGLLQSALATAALTNGAAAGAAAMAAFAVASSAGLWLGPWAWQRALGGGAVRVRREALLVRAGGLLLVLASGWALTHGLWARFAAWCGIG